MSYKALIILTLFFGILAILFLFITIKRIITARENEAKHTLPSTIAALFSALFAFLAYLNITLPPPIIYPLDGDTLPSYIDNVEIRIESDSGLEIYYSIDAYSDPKNGSKYDDIFVITETTTVSARSTFLWWWSDIVIRPYKFEKINFSDQLQLSYENNNNTYVEGNTLLPESDTKDAESYNNGPDKNQNSSNEAEQNDLSETKTEGETESEPESEPETNIETESTTIEQETQSQIATTESSNIVEGLNPTEGYNLMNYINQYRVEAGLAELSWNSNLEQDAQNLAMNYATGDGQWVFGYFHVIGRQCNGAKNAQRAVSDWMTGNDYVPSEAAYLLSQDFTQIGGALYYLPSGNEYGYHYFWVVCLL